MTSGPLCCQSIGAAVLFPRAARGNGAQCSIKRNRGRKPVTADDRVNLNTLATHGLGASSTLRPIAPLGRGLDQASWAHWPAQKAFAEPVAPFRPVGLHACKGAADGHH